MGKSASAFCFTELCSRALTGVVTGPAKCVVVFIFNFLYFHQVHVAVTSIMEWSTLWCILLCVSSTSCEGIWIFSVSQTCNFTVSTAILSLTRARTHETHTHTNVSGTLVYRFDRQTARKHFFLPKTMCPQLRT